jgi:hypothetical protein
LVLPRKKKEQLEEAGDLAGANAIPSPGAAVDLGAPWDPQLRSSWCEAERVFVANRIISNNFPRKDESEPLCFEKGTKTIFLLPGISHFERQAPMLRLYINDPVVHHNQKSQCVEQPIC